MAAGRIIVDLLFRSGSFETDTKKAAKALKELKKEAIDAGKVIATAAVGYAAAATAFVKSSIDTADAASKAAVSAGVTTEAFTGLAYAAGLAGIEQNELSKTLAKINTDIATNEKVYAKLGISLTDASGKAKTADQVLGDLAEVFSKLPADANRSALAAQIFGEKIGPRLLPLLVTGRKGIADLVAEAKSFGAVISTEAGQAAEQFNDNLSRLETIVRGAGLSIAEKLLPQLVNLSERLVQNAKDFGLLRGAALSFFEFFLGGTDLVDVATRKIVDLEAAIESTNDQIRAAADRGDNASIAREGAILEKQEAQLRQLKSQLEFAKQLEEGRKPAPVVRPTGVVPDGVIGGGGGGSKAPKVSDFQRYLEGLEKQKQGLFELSEVEKTLAAIRAGELGKLTATQEARALAVAKEIDDTRRAQQVAQERADFRRAEEEAIKQFEDEQAARRSQALEAQKQEAQAVFDATRTPLENYLSRIERLNQLYAQGAIDADTWGRAVVQASTAFDESRAKVDEVKSVGEELGLTFTSAFEDAIVEGRKFSDVLKGLEQDIIRIITRRLVTEPLTNAISGFFSGGGGSGITSAIGSFFGGAFATGGDAMPGRQYLVGESGPEIFVPRTAGAVVPTQLGSTPGQGRQVVQNISFSVQGQVDYRTQQQIAARVARSVASANVRMN